MPGAQAWTRQSHSLAFGDMQVNLLFGTLLLGLQRLETDVVLPRAHQSMLEDMLEGWTWGDTQQCCRDNGTFSYFSGASESESAASDDE